MKNTLLQFRYYLEIIAIPAFIFLVIHLSGHGLMMLVEDNHNHDDHGHAEHGLNVQEILESILTVEVLGGILMLIFFTWLWHLPALKKWVPCSHDYCKSEVPVSHIVAIVALCLHFFPEAGIRQELLHHALEGEIESLMGFLGFIAHFLIDVLIAIILSSYWKTKKGFWTCLTAIVATWLTAFFLAEHFVENIPQALQAPIYLGSAFMLCMFIHKPHKPQKKDCGC